jgi:hypothetical protein
MRVYRGCCDLIPRLFPIFHQKFEPESAVKQARCAAKHGVCPLPHLASTTRFSWPWLMGKQDSNMADFFMKLLSLFEYGIKITNLDAGAGHVPSFWRVASFGTCLHKGATRRRWSPSRGATGLPESDGLRYRMREYECGRYAAVSREGIDYTLQVL